MLFCFQSLLIALFRGPEFGHWWGYEHSSSREHGDWFGELFGSHLDTVIDCGKHDGPAGVIGALEAIPTISEKVACPHYFCPHFFPRLILGGKPSPETLISRMRKALS